MVEIIKSFNASPYLKFCLSSRPHTNFNHAFGHDPSKVISVSGLTSGDIWLYVHDSLDKNPSFQSMKLQYPDRCKQLVDDVVNHANGVFLWVYLVVARLLEGIKVNNDRMGDLERKLQRTPKELDQLFRHILDNVECDYHESQAHMFRAACLAEEPLDLMAYYFMDFEDTDYALKMPMPPLDRLAVKENQRIMAVRVDVRCKGLLEVINIGNPDIDPEFRRIKVQLIHRTFRDFITLNSMQEFIALRSARNFDPYRALCLAPPRRG
jgi:hypothetical protein